MIILAYIDPGLGALIWQSIVAAVVGFFFYLKKTRRWIVGWYRKIAGRAQPDATKVVVGPVPSATAPAAKVEAKIEVR